MKNNRTISIFIAVVILLPFTVFGVVNWYEKKFSKLPVYNQGQPLTAFNLQNQEGKMIRPGQWRGKIVVVDFFFTHCPSICPKMTRSLKKVQDAYDNDASVVINSFTVDPERDSVATLKQYANRYGVKAEKWNLLTGNKIEIYRLARKNFMIVATDGDGGANDFIHSEKLVLLDPALRIRGYYDGTSEKEVNQLINDIKKLKNEN